MSGAGPSTEAGQKRPLRPEMLAGMLRSAHTSLDQGRYAEAIAAYRAILDRDPQNVEALTHLGEILRIAGHAEGALMALDKALDPHDVHAFYDKGTVLYELKQDYAGAIQVWEAFLARVPRGPDAEHIRARIQEARARLASGAAVPALGTSGSE